MIAGLKVQFVVLVLLVQLARGQTNATCTDVESLLKKFTVNVAHDIRAICGNCKYVVYPETGYDTLATCTRCNTGFGVSRPVPQIMDHFLQKNSTDIYSVRLLDFNTQCIVIQALNNSTKNNSSTNNTSTNNSSTGDKKTALVLAVGTHLLGMVLVLSLS